MDDEEELRDDQIAEILDDDEDEEPNAYSDDDEEEVSNSEIEDDLSGPVQRGAAAGRNKRKRGSNY